MVIRNLAVANYHVMRQNAPYRLVESTSDAIFRYFKLPKRLGISLMQFLHCLFGKIQRGRHPSRPDVGKELQPEFHAATIRGAKPVLNGHHSSLWNDPHGLPAKRAGL